MHTAFPREESFKSFVFATTSQWYKTLALWRVINVDKGSLSLFPLWFFSFPKKTCISRPYCNFLWVFWFLCKHLSNFVPSLPQHTYKSCATGNGSAFIIVNKCPCVLHVAFSIFFYKSLFIASDPFYTGFNWGRRNTQIIQIQLVPIGMQSLWLCARLARIDIRIICRVAQSQDLKFHIK